jgi:hypothetical protein
LASLLIVLFGFQDFFFRGGRATPGAREIAPQIRTLVIIHGAFMSSWIVFFLAQTLLVATGRQRLHMAMGPVAFALAIGIVVTASWVNVESTRIAAPSSMLFTMTRKQFMASGFANVLLFTTTFSFGLWHRKRPDIHRPMMLLTTLGLLDAAIGRIDAVTRVYEGTVLERILGPEVGMLTLLLTLFLLKWAMEKKPDKWYLAGYGLIFVTHLASIQFARTAAWDRIASRLLG